MSNPTHHSALATAHLPADIQTAAELFEHFFDILARGGHPNLEERGRSRQPAPLFDWLDPVTERSELVSANNANGTAPVGPRSLLGADSLRCYFVPAEAVDKTHSPLTFYPIQMAMDRAQDANPGGDSDQRWRAGSALVSSVRQIVSASDRTSWSLSLQGADAEVVRQILLRSRPPLILYETSRSSREETLMLTALALDKGYDFFEDAHDMCYFDKAIFTSTGPGE